MFAFRKWYSFVVLKNLTLILKQLKSEKYSSISFEIQTQNVIFPRVLHLISLGGSYVNHCSVKDVCLSVYHSQLLLSLAPPTDTTRNFQKKLHLFVAGLGDKEKIKYHNIFWPDSLIMILWLYGRIYHYKIFTQWDFWWMIISNVYIITKRVKTNNRTARTVW